MPLSTTMGETQLGKTGQKSIQIPDIPVLELWDSRGLEMRLELHLGEIEWEILKQSQKFERVMRGSLMSGFSVSFGVTQMWIRALELLLQGSTSVCWV